MKAISSDRRALLSMLLLNTKGVITISDAERILSLPRPKARYLLWSLARNKWLNAIKSGVYVPVPLESLDSFPIEDPLKLAGELFQESYIGGWDAASHWGLTDQLFLKTWVFTTQKVPHKVYHVKNYTFLLTFIRRDKLFGLKVEWRGDVKIWITNPTRTLVDFAQYIGDFGLMAFIDIVKSYLASEYRDINKLMTYIEKMGNRTLFKRIGFILEKLVPEEKEAIEICKRNMSKGYSKIAPNLGCPRIVRRWNLKIPEGFAID